MRVVLDSEAEVAGRRCIGLDEHILAGPHELDDREREIGKVIGIFLPLREEEFVECLRVRIGGQRGALLRGQLDDAVPAFGTCTMRRMDAMPALSKVRATTPLEATMNSSISEVARFFSMGAMPTICRSPYRPRLDGLEIERAMLKAAARHALRGCVLQLELGGKIGARGNFGGRRGCALKPRAYAWVS